MKNNKKVIIVVISVITAILFLMGFFVYKQNQKIAKNMKEEKIEEKEEKLETGNKTENSTEVVFKTKEKPSLSEKRAEQVAELAKEKMYNFDFNDTMSFMSEEIDFYNRDNLPEEFDNLFQDVARLESLQWSIKSGSRDLAINSLNHVKDVDAFLMGVLSLDMKDRLYILKTEESINPLIEEDEDGEKIFEMVKREDITDIYKEENIEQLNRLTDVEKVYKHTFKLIDDGIIYSYIVQIDGNYQFIMMTQDESNTGGRHLTIKQYRELFK